MATSEKLIIQAIFLIENS